jgi:hypothetical protein
VRRVPAPSSSRCGRASRRSGARSRRSGRDITELVKLGWQLTKIALREQRQGNALAVVSAEGRILKELVIAD